MITSAFGQLHGIAAATCGMMTQSNIRHAICCMQTCDSDTLVHDQYYIKHVVQQPLKLRGALLYVVYSLSSGLCTSAGC